MIVRNHQFYGASSWVSITTRPASKSFVVENIIYLFIDNQIYYINIISNDILVEICHLIQFHYKRLRFFFKFTNERRNYKNKLNLFLNYKGPSGLLAPYSVAYNSTTILVAWFPPNRPNGLLTSYAVVIGQLIRIQISNVTVHSLEVSDLSPFTEYKVSVIACTGLKVFFFILKIHYLIF